MVLAACSPHTCSSVPGAQWHVHGVPCGDEGIKDSCVNTCVLWCGVSGVMPCHVYALH